MKCLINLLFFTFVSGINVNFMGNSMAGTIVINNNGQINCDYLICPEKTFKCRVTKTSIPGTKDMEVIKLCLDITGKVLFQEKQKMPAPYEGFKTYAEANLQGDYILNDSNLSPEEQARMQEEIQHQVRSAVNQANYITAQTNSMASQLTQQINHQVNGILMDVHENLARTFSAPFYKRK